jgi:hypothetical protein
MNLAGRLALFDLDGTLVDSAPGSGPPSGRRSGSAPRGTARGRGVARRATIDIVTMPDDDQRDVAPLGSEVAPPGDEESQGGEPGPASGIAGPSYPPAETEPDAQRD